MSLGGIPKAFLSHCLLRPKSSNFLDILWLFPTGQSSVNLCLCHYGYIRILKALSNLTHVSWELLFQRQMVDTSLTAPQAGSQPPWPLELPCLHCSSDQLTWSAACSSNHSLVQLVIWQPQRQMHHTRILSLSYSHVAGKSVPGVSVANSVNLHDPVIWPSLKASALGFAEWMNARGT